LENPGIYKIIIKDLNNVEYLAPSCHLETKSISLKGTYQKRKMLFSECGNRSKK
jgi:hypothetical protein